MVDATTVLSCGDNYVYVYQHAESEALVVDPADARQVLEALGRAGLTLSAILVTHHHWDHTAGVAALKSETGCEVISADRRRIKGTSRAVTDGETICIGVTEIAVLSTPGHTRSSVCYYLPPAASGGTGMVWTGDTLFVGGCGRPMECDAVVLWRSLAKVAALPEETLVYCGHDYTAENYEFALTIEPDCEVTRRRLRDVEEAARQGLPSVPSTIGQEKATNVFLRAGTAAVQRALGMADAPAERVFAELRRRKNAFG
jgi:hydroxyacylglutathione hydrolase